LELARLATVAIAERNRSRKSIEAFIDRVLRSSYTRRIIAFLIRKCLEDANVNIGSKWTHREHSVVEGRRKDQWTAKVLTRPVDHYGTKRGA
jgi:hypothetical protein